MEQPGNGSAANSLFFKCEELSSISTGRVMVVRFTSLGYHIKRYFPGEQIFGGRYFEKQRKNKVEN